MDIQMKNSDEYALFFKALGDKTRLSIVDILSKRGKYCIQDIAKKVGKEQSTVFRHVQVLKQAGIISTIKEDKCLLCTLVNPAKMSGFLGYVSKCKDACGGR
jgi:ArsR family transcriptional regulator, lead/cadmium/zinc/bismuth-responsive transcriptional repressor